MGSDRNCEEIGGIAIDHLQNGAEPLVLLQPGLAVGLVAADAAAMRDFYMGGLGLDVLGEASFPPLTVVRLRAGWGALKLLCFEQAPPALPAPRALPAMSFAVPDLAPALAAARDHGARIAGREDRAVTLTDPDGNRVVLYEQPGAPGLTQLTWPASDPATLRTFYHETVGFEGGGAQAPAAVVAGKVTLAFEPGNSGGGKPMGAESGVRFVTVAVAGVHSLHDRLADAGVSIPIPLQSNAEGTAWAFFAADPGGNLMEFVSDRL